MLRLRFLRRDSEGDPVCSNPEACLTPPGLVTLPGETQETRIDPDRNWAEVVRILVDAYNPYDTTQTEDVSERIGISEIAKPLYQNDRNTLRRQLFYDGKYSSSLIDSASGMVAE